jgi:hypothetical protein
MVVGLADKGFQQCDWWKTKVCALGLYTRGQQLKDNALQNVYLEALFVIFVAKNLFGGRMFIHNIYGNPNSL